MKRSALPLVRGAYGRVRTAGVAPVVAAVRRAVVGHDALDRHTLASEPGDRALQERHRAGLALVRQHLAVGQAGGVVDADMHGLPAGTTLTIAPIAGDPMADRRDPSELLGVDVEQLAGPRRRWRRKRSISATHAAGTPCRQCLGAERRSISAAGPPAR